MNFLSDHPKLAKDLIPSTSWTGTSLGWAQSDEKTVGKWILPHDPEAWHVGYGAPGGVHGCYVWPSVPDKVRPYSC